MKVSKGLRFAAQGDAKFQQRWPDWLLDRWPAWSLQRLLCLVDDHEPIADQCNKPEHDHCAWCGKLMPGASRREPGARHGG